MHHRRCAKEGHEARRVIGRAAGHFVALFIPGFDNLGFAQNPLTCRRHRVVADLINQACGLGFLRIAQFALEQERGCRHGAHLAHEAGGAARAGENANHDFRQADLGLWVVRRKNPMRRQRNFQTDAKPRAGHHAGDRLAALVGLGIHAGAFDFAQDAVHVHDAVKQALGRVVPRHFLHLG